ncbi:MAG: DUF389 domain-containing protein, partial [Acidimicrobiales bacterium]
ACQHRPVAELLHVRVVATEDVADAVTAAVSGDPSACNIVVMPDAARAPRGDVIMFDIAREGINQTLRALHDLGVGEHGSISVFRADLSLSAAVDTVHERVPGEPEDTVVWDQVATNLRQSVSVRFSYIAFFVVAAVIAAAGILTDSPILIVGAMVVGPEYGPLASMAYGLETRDTDLARRGLATFAVGTGVGIVAGFALAGAFRLFDAVPDVYEDDGRSLTAFITEPDAFSVLVAVAAAIAGTLALTHDRSGTLVGVLISVTTIPAIADIGVGLAFWDRSEVVGAATQLAINLVCLVAVGALTLAVLRRFTPGGDRAVWHP